MKKQKTTFYPTVRSFMLLLIMFLLCAPITYAEEIDLNFGHLFHEHGSVMLIIDQETGEILHANDAAARFYGYPLDELTGMNIDRINQLSPEEVTEEMAAAVGEDRNYFEFQHQLASGEVRSVEVYSYPYHHQGKPLLFSIIQNISPRVEAEQQARRRLVFLLTATVATAFLLLLFVVILLRNRFQRIRHSKELYRQNQRFHALIKASNTGAWEYNRRTGMVHCSPEYYRIRGYQVKDNETVADDDMNSVVFDHVHPEDVERVKKVFYAYMKEPQYMYENIFRVRHVNGSWRWILSRGQVLQNELGENTDTFLGTHIDITEQVMNEEALRESESRLKQMAEESRIVNWEVDADGRYTYVSEVAGTVWGYNPDELVGKKHVYDLHPKEGRDAFKEEVLALFREQKPIKGFLKPVATGNGAILWMSTSAIALKNPEGTLEGYRGNDVDVTELRNAKEEAEAANRSKDFFLANMTHELKTPLNGIVGANQLLETTELTQEQKEYLEISKTSSNSLMRIVEDILDYTRLQTNYMELHPVVISLRDMLEEVNQLFRVSAREKELEYHSFIADQVPDVIFADGFRIRQILTNLLGNAVKYTREGRVQLVVDAEESPETKRVRMHFRVEDTGIGIPEEEREKIFDQFHRVESSPYSVGQGTGLGLSISIHLAHLMGGEIRVESEPGVGSIFTFICEVERAELE